MLLACESHTVSRTVRTVASPTCSSSSKLLGPMQGFQIGARAVLSWAALSSCNNLKSFQDLLSLEPWPMAASRNDWWRVTVVAAAGGFQVKPSKRSREDLQSVECFALFLGAGHSPGPIDPRDRHFFGRVLQINPATCSDWQRLGC